MFFRMRSIRFSLLLLFFLFLLSETESPPEPESPSAIEQKKPQFPVPTPVTRKAPEEDNFLGPPECLEKKFTRASCNLVFCPPWERCIDGQCNCKLPYMCPTENVTAVCGRDSRSYRSFCQVMAISCRTKKPFMSHFGDNCQETNPKFKSSIDSDSSVVKVFIPQPKSTEGGEELLVCGDLWDMAAANVACREHGNPLGAAAADSVSYYPLTVEFGNRFPDSCISVRCQGYETSLAECVIYDKISTEDNMVATATCYEAPQGNKCGFKCVNSKCVSLNQTCDGVDDCGDQSDEMCCKNCRNGAFRCKTGVCVHKDTLTDGVHDCLDGEDESSKHTSKDSIPEEVSVSSFSDKEAAAMHQTPQNTEYSSPHKEIKANRKYLESMLKCGVPNKTAVAVDVRGRNSRVKRVVGGLPAEPTQIQWQIALVEKGKIDCGGAFIGGCWVITAAHCVRPNPSAFKVKFSLWRKFRAQSTTDIVPVKDIIIHHRYNASSYENDIALVKLEKLPFLEKCFEDNPAISAICVPWSTQLFQLNHTCSISGWGRTKDGKASQVLLWANVSLIEGCDRFYKNRFKPGMMCAGGCDAVPTGIHQDQLFTGPAQV